MTPEEEQIEIEKIYDSIFPMDHTYDQAYKNLQKYKGKYKRELTGRFMYDLCRIYCGGYYRYGQKQTDIENDAKSLYLKMCDTQFYELNELDKAIYYFFKGHNEKVIPCIEELFENTKEIDDEIKPMEPDFCQMFLEKFKDAYKGFWPDLAKLSLKYNYEENAELCTLMDKFYNCEDNNHAIDLLLAFLQTHPSYILPFELLGNLYTDEKMYYNAIQCFEKIRNKNVLFDISDIEFFLGWAYGKVKDYKEEEKAYRKCLERASLYGNALNNLGYCLYKQKKYNEAIEIFKQCIAEKRDLYCAPHNLVRSYIRVGLYEDARKFIDENKFKISKYLIDQLEKKPKKNQKITPAVSDEDDNVDVPDEQAEVEITTKFFEKKSQFSSEKVLEDELTSRLESGQPIFGLNLHIYRKKGDYYGRQYPCADGKWRLDLLCEDKDENLYILELKKDSGYSDAFEQIKQYVDWFEKNKVKKGKKVYGIIVLNSPKKNLIEKVRTDDRIRLFEYQIAYKEIK